MQDEDKTKQRLISELAVLGKRVVELEEDKEKGKREEETLRESEPEYRSICENCVKGIYRVTPEVSIPERIRNLKLLVHTSDAYYTVGLSHSVDRESAFACH